MEVNQLENLATLRTVVGYLGEKDQYAWWQSFFRAQHEEATMMGTSR